MTAAEHIHIIGKDQDSQEEPRTDAANEAAPAGTPDEIPGEEAAQDPRSAAPMEAVDKTSRDMGRVALLVAILAVILLAVFFFGVNQNISGLSTRVDGLAGLKEDVALLGGRVNDVEARMQALPVKARKMVVGAMLQEMAQRTAYLGTQMDTEQQNEKLHQAMELLQQVQVEVAQEAQMAPAAPAPAN